MTEIVYILTNEAMPGLVKIGAHRGDDLVGLIRGLYQSGLPFVSSGALISTLSLAMQPSTLEQAMET
jgi:hypothetical protein